jgi:aquaporin Z
MKGDLKPLVAEFLGTFALTFFGAGAICTNQWTGGAVGLLGIAFAHAMALAVMISAMGHVSGGHFNPAVSIALLTAGKIEGGKAFAYIGSQLLGAAGAALLLTQIFPAEVWQAVGLGGASLHAELAASEGIILEAVMTFFLVLTVFGTAVDPKGSWNAIAGFGIGSVLFFDILMGGPLTGAAMNPARAFGPALVARVWDDQLVYWIGPVIGGVAAAILSKALFLQKR